MKIKKYFIYFFFLTLFILKVFFKEHHFVVEYISFQKWIPFVFFTLMFSDEFKEKGLSFQLLEKTWFVIPFLLIRGLDIAGIQIPYLTEHIFNLSFSLVIINIIINWIKLGTYEKAVHKCLPERTAYMASFETRLSKEFINFFVILLSKKLIIPNQRYLRILRMATILGIILTLFLTWISFSFYEKDPIILLVWVLLPYSLSWPLGIYQISSTSEMIETEDAYSSLGLFKFKILKSNIINKDLYSKENKKGSVTLFPFLVKGHVLRLKHPLTLNFYGRRKEFNSVVIPILPK